MTSKERQQEAGPALSQFAGRAVSAGLLLALVIGASVAQAQPRRPDRPLSEEQAARTVASWVERMRSIDALLVEGEAEKAYRRVTRLLTEMNDRIVSSPATGELLGLGTVLRAIAAVQLGREQEGLWHWHVALQLFPEFADYKMNAYGDAGPFLKDRPPRAYGEGPKDGLADAASYAADEVQPPRKLRTPKPRFPQAKRRGGQAVQIVVEMIVDAKGKPREPRIVDSKGELTLVLATLDALKDWEFEPARRRGVPVAVIYNLEVNFRP